MKMKRIIDFILTIVIILLFGFVILDVVGMILFLSIANIDGCPSIFDLICKLF